MMNIFKGIFAEKSPSFLILLLLMGALIGAVVASLPVMGGFMLYYGKDANMQNYPAVLRLLQGASALGTFLFPALLVAWTGSKHPAHFLHAKRRGLTPQVWGMTLLMLFLLMPAINLTTWLNEQLVLPESLAGIEAWMRNAEEEAARMVERLIADGGWLALIENLIVVAGLAALTEEIFFRGVLFRIFMRWTGKRHLAIWIVAILFSAMHMQFYGFLPRMLLGAFFGYLLIWSGSIWLPVAAHFVNNAFAVVGMSVDSLRDNAILNGEITKEQLPTYIVIATVCLVLCFVMAHRFRRNCLETLLPKDEVLS